MNFGMSILFRAIPLVMGMACLGLGWYVFQGGADASHQVAGHVLMSLTAICIALFTTAATIIRQLTRTYAPIWKVVLPAIGYGVAAGTAVWGLVVRGGPSAPDFVAGHVIFGVALIAACVTTVAVASSAFILIPANNARSHADGAPPEAYGRPVSILLQCIPLVAALVLAVWAGLLLADSAQAPKYVAGHVMMGLAAICASLISLVATAARQVRNDFDSPERWAWSLWVALLGSVVIAWGLFVLFGSERPERLAPGCILIGLGLICFSILSKVFLLAAVWRREFALANRVPMIPVFTCLACLFFAAFLTEATQTQPGLFVPSRVLTGLGAVCFTLFSIVSILEEGTSRKA